MRAPPARRQRTFCVDGKCIRIVSRRITRQANHAGWEVDINGTTTRQFVLERDEAEYLAYVAWVQAHA